MKDTLFHINWGDGDTTFVIAPDEQTAKERMGDGEDMVNSIVRLDHLYQMIYKAGQRDMEEWMNEPCTEHMEGYLRRECRKCWHAQRKEWGL